MASGFGGRIEGKGTHLVVQALDLGLVVVLGEGIGAALVFSWLGVEGIGGIRGSFEALEVHVNRLLGFEVLDLVVLMSGFLSLMALMGLFR